MTQYTTINDIPWPELGDEPDVEEAVKPALDVVDSLLIPRFTSTSSRDLKIAAPIQGMACYVTGTGPMFYGPPGVWVPFPGVDVCQLRSFAEQSTTTSVVLTWDTEDYDPYLCHSLITNPERITPVFPGRYKISTQGGFVAFNADHNVSISVYKNGAVLLGSQFWNVGTTAVAVASAGTTISTSANGTTDYFEVVMTQGTGVSKTLSAGSACPSVNFTYQGPSH